MRTLIAWVGTFGKDNNKLAQMGHFLAGALVGSWFGWHGCLWFTGGWVIPKEAGIDPKYENAPFLWSGAIDMGFYLLGQAVGLAHKYLVR